MEAPNERLQAILSRIIGPTVLHVGCVGEGGEKFLVHSALHKGLPGCEIWGVDTNASGIRELERQGFRVVVADAESMELNRQFDTIFAGELIEHLSNPGRFLDRCRGMLKPHGRLVLSTPNPFSVEHFGMYMKNFRRAFNQGHTLWLCAQTLEQISRRSGLKMAELVFVDNLCPEFVTSRWSKGYAVVWKLIRPLLPRRFRGTIVAVLQQS
jgi:2-polyprenyl-3-methyl-5-hydroxy-6-metoxy-1,4-benzoquinol methylase